ncbi:MAG: hypothetical protein Q9M31_09175 [Mariprofundus sp.]|nr:hypothetical protein [Mariprofundus sp.]
MNTTHRLAEKIKMEATPRQIEAWFARSLEDAFKSMEAEATNFAWFSNKKLNR